MSIEWEEVEDSTEISGFAERLVEGFGGSGETYKVWYGLAFLNPDHPPVNRWIAMGWPEYDSDSLPHFDSYDDAIELCERWDSIKIDAEKQARAAFTGTRTGQG